MKIKLNDTGWEAEVRLATFEEDADKKLLLCLGKVTQCET